MSEPQPKPGPQISWPVAVVLVAMMAAIVIVALFGPGQTAIVVMVGLTLMGGLGLNVVRSTEAKQEATAAKENGNGNATRMLELIEAQGKLLALSQPPPAVVDAEVVPDTGPPSAASVLPPA